MKKNYRQNLTSPLPFPASLETPLPQQFFKTGKIRQGFQCWILNDLVTVTFNPRQRLLQVMNSFVVMIQRRMRTGQLIKRMSIIGIYRQRLLAEIHRPLGFTQLQNRVSLVSQGLTIAGFYTENVVVYRNLICWYIFLSRPEP